MLTNYRHFCGRMRCASSAKRQRAARRHRGAPFFFISLYSSTWIRPRFVLISTLTERHKHIIDTDKPGFDGHYPDNPGLASSPLIRTLHWFLSGAFLCDVQKFFISSLTQSHQAFLERLIPSVSIISQFAVGFPDRQCLWSSSTLALDVPPTWLSTISDSAFPVTARTWNSLPARVTSSNFLRTFKTKLKSHFLLASFP